MRLADIHLSFQELSTGHIAPAGDGQVAGNTASLNHLGQIVHGTPMQELPKGSLVIDCGAFIGDTALDFLSHGFKVIAIEPCFDNYVCLCANSPKSINIMAIAGNGQPAKMGSTMPGDNYGMRQSAFDALGVPSLRLDDLPIDRVALIKIDVEGDELFVLEGAEKLIERDSPMMWIEAFPEKLHDKAVSIEALALKIQSLGYGMRPYGSPPRWDWLCSKDIPKTERIMP